MTTTIFIRKDRITFFEKMGDLHGRIELIMGNMFSGKTSDLIRKIGRYQAAGKEAQLFKPTLDVRYGLGTVTSHDRAQTDAHHVNDIGNLIEALRPETEIIGIDEVQFFPGEVIDFCVNQAEGGRIVVVAALYRDFRGQPFPFRDSARNVYELAAVADDVRTLSALCTHSGNGRICGRDAAWVQRFIDGKIAPKDSPTILVGAQEFYAPRCRQHFVRYE